jgi:hypothetical protein
MGANPNILLPGFWRSGAHGIPVPVVWPLLRIFRFSSTSLSKTPLDACHRAKRQLPQFDAVWQADCGHDESGKGGSHGGEGKAAQQNTVAC